MWIFRQPDYTKSYVVAAGVARGDGADFSAFHVIEMDSPIKPHTLTYLKNLSWVKELIFIPDIDF